MLEIANFEVNGGEGITFRRGDRNIPVSLEKQNSVVKHLMVEFSAPVTLDAGAFTLAAKTVTVNHSPNPSSTAPTLAWRQMAGGGGKTWIITFSGTGSDAVTGKLADGVYELTIHADKVHSAAGSLSGDGVYVVAALFGSRIDQDPETDNNTILVDAAQVSLFNRFFGAIAGDGGYNGYSPGADINLDGYCDPADSLSLTLASWTWTTGT